MSKPPRTETEKERVREGGGRSGDDEERGGKRARSEGSSFFVSACPSETESFFRGEEDFSG